MSPLAERASGIPMMTLLTMNLGIVNPLFGLFSGSAAAASGQLSSCDLVEREGNNQVVALPDTPKNFFVVLAVLPVWIVRLVDGDDTISVWAGVEVEVLPGSNSKIRNMENFSSLHGSPHQ